MDSHIMLFLRILFRLPGGLTFGGRAFNYRLVIRICNWNFVKKRKRGYALGWEWRKSEGLMAYFRISA